VAELVFDDYALVVDSRPLEKLDMDDSLVSEVMEFDASGVIDCDWLEAIRAEHWPMLSKGHVAYHFVKDQVFKEMAYRWLEARKMIREGVLTWG
jgi:hypothetical protein